MNDNTEMKEPVVPSASFSQKINVLVEYCSTSNLYSMETAENASIRERIEKIHKALQIVALKTAELEKLANNKDRSENLENTEFIENTESITQFLQGFNTRLMAAACTCPDGSKPRCP